MRPLTILLVIYCLAAAVGLGIWGWQAIAETGRLAEHLQSEEQELAGLEQVADAKLQALRKLEASQREGRKKFSGPEAVDASYAVQIAEAEYDAAELAVDEASHDIAALEREHESQSRLIVPLVAGVLLHLLVGIALVGSSPRGKHAR